MRFLCPAAAALLAALMLTGVAVAAPSPAAAGYADWYTYHGSTYRGGFASTMPHANGVPRALHDIKLDGAVYASPLVIGGDTVVATENNTVYVFGPKYRVRLKVHLGAPSPAGERPCGDIDPLGITGTPIYGKKFNVIYVAAELGNPVRHNLYAISFSNGAVKWKRSLDRPGVETDAMQQRGALAIDYNRVWVPFGALAGDCGGYKGRVVGIYRDGTSSAASYTSPTKRGGGIWSPPGPVVDNQRRMYVISANGAAFPGDAYDYTNSAIRLTYFGRRVDNFAPSDWALNNQQDVGLGSNNVAVVGQFLVVGGKSGPVYTLRRDHLGGVGGAVYRKDICPAYGGSAVHGDIVYLPCVDGVRAVRVGPHGGLSVLWHTASSRTGAPVVGGGRIWTLDPNAGQLYSLNPRTGHAFRHVFVGQTSRFATPAIYGRNVIVPTLTGITVVATS